MKVVMLVDADVLPADDLQCERLHGGLTDDHYWVMKALRQLGHQTAVIPFEPTVQVAIENILAFEPDVVFNYMEQIEGDRLRAVHVTGLLELLQLPFTGSGPLAQSITLDKALTKELLRYHEVPVPEFFVVRPGETSLPRELKFPLFVKPVHGGGKEGISLRSLTRNRSALEARIADVHRIYQQPAICERYIEGRELTIAVMGNDRLETFPARELVFSEKHADGPQFMTERVLEDSKYRARWDIKMCDACLTTAQERELARLSKVAYRAIGLQGYARMDIRLGLDGRFYVIEVNANPALRPPVASLIQPWGRLPYEKLIAKVIKLALEKHGGKKRRSNSSARRNGGERKGNR
jgi:D-alanine-D-alanine ligase and related ATP-grasp enzymes